MPVSLRPWIAGLVAWLVLAAITAAQNYTFFAWAGRPMGVWTAIWRELIMFGLWAALTPPIVVVTRWALRRGGVARLVHVPVMVACAVAHNAAIVASRYAIEDRALPPALEQLWTSIGRAFIIDVILYACVVLVVEAVAWATTSRRRAEEAARLESHLTRARLEALRGQLHPHFLFNALHAVSSLIESDPPGARRMIVRLADLLRATIDLRGPEIALREELALVQRYLDVQRVRFSDRLTVTVEVPAELGNAAVPALLLQPLVENALRHGIDARPGPGTVTIRGARDGDRLRLIVSDDGAGPPDAARQGTGLAVTRAALTALHGSAASLTLRAISGGGAEAVVELPWRDAP